MVFAYDATGVEMKSVGSSIPDGKYTLRIVSSEEGITGNGDPKVTVKYEVEEGPYRGKNVNYHTITFFKDKSSKGAGIALHFLKCIGQPFEGAFQVNSRAWIGCLVTAKIVNEKNKNDGNTYPRVKFVDAYAKDYTAPVVDETDPFA